MQRGRYSLARVRPFGPRQLAAPHGARLAARARPRLFRGHVDCLPRPAVRGRWALMAAAPLPGLQGLTPDRHPDFLAALCGTGGALAAALLAEGFIRAWRRVLRPQSHGVAASLHNLESAAIEFIDEVGGLGVFGLVTRSLPPLRVNMAPKRVNAMCSNSAAVRR